LSAPLIELPEGDRCCDGTVSNQVAELPHRQRFLLGSTAWRISCGRRQVVEGANGTLKGSSITASTRAGARTTQRSRASAASWS
jgi:hypothetical protein